jgi:hypothetical protein
VNERSYNAVFVVNVKGIGLFEDSPFQERRGAQGWPAEKNEGDCRCAQQKRGFADVV